MAPGMKPTRQDVEMFVDLILVTLIDGQLCDEMDQKDAHSCFHLWHHDVISKEGSLKCPKGPGPRT